MAGLNIGIRDVRTVAAVLEQEFASAEDAARAVLEEAFRLYEAKARFVVVGQLRYTRDGGWLDAEDASASKVALGVYGTETPATKDAESLAISNSTGEEFRAWVLPMFHGTPAAYYKKRKEALEKKAADDEAAQRKADALQQTMQRLAQQHGWATQAELDEAQRETCPECGQSLDGPDGLATGHQVSAA